MSNHVVQWYTLVGADGGALAGPATSADALPEAGPGETVAVQDAVPRPAAWRVATGLWETITSRSEAPRRLRVDEFRARWTWAERVAFEVAAASDPEMRAIANELAARTMPIAEGGGVNPASDLTVMLASRVEAAGIITAARRAAITAPIGTYAGEPGYPLPTAPAPPPEP